MLLVPGEMNQKRLHRLEFRIFTGSFLKNYSGFKSCINMTYCTQHNPRANLVESESTINLFLVLSKNR